MRWLLVLFLACSKTSDAGVAPIDTGVDAPLVDASDASDVRDVAEDHYVSPVGHWKSVLHAGDSTVGFLGGLTKALDKRFTARGLKFYSSSWTSAGLVNFADEDRFEKLLAKLNPDAVIINLGINNVTAPHPENYIGFIKRIVKKVGKRECYWIGPPAWKPDKHLLVPVLRDNVAPCIFFESSTLNLERQSDDVHPTDKGGDDWAHNILYFIDTGRRLDEDLDAGTVLIGDY